MNIFFVDRNPVMAAKCLCDQHVVKMTLETAQILSTACIELGVASKIPGLYKATHKNHPSCVWARSSPEHFNWLLAHGIALGEEYTERFGKVHRSAQVFLEILKSKSIISKHAKFPTTGWSDPPIAVRDPLRAQVTTRDKQGKIDVVASYRKYYRDHKKVFGVVRKRNASWKQNKPTWL